VEAVITVFSRARRSAISTVVVAVVTALSPGAAAQVHAQESSADFFLGTAWSLPMPLVVRLPDERRAIRARYATRPLSDAPYYAYRLGGGPVGHAIETELVHHKIYLLDPPPFVEHFEISHGYNLLLVNAVAPTGGLQARFGVGVVIAHPEGRIAGRQVGARRGRARTWLGGGYHIAGVATQLAIGRRYALGPGATSLTATPEMKITAAFARVPLEEGTVTVPNVAVHALAGIGARRRW
jgi:hypothetical protein